MTDHEAWRRHLITGDPVLFAPGRASRPHAFGDPAAAGERCPFCQGHESDTPPAIVTLGDPWRVRVFPNKYPPIDGAEVVVESPDHGITFDRIEHAAEVVETYVDRYRAHRGAPAVAIFKNEGTKAGSSIPHIHSQVVPLPFVPPRLQREGAAFAAASHCPLCAAIDTHRQRGLSIRENETFAWIAPVSSTMPYQQWILPKRHMNTMRDLTSAETSDLADLLRSAAGAMRGIGDSFNWTFVNFEEPESAHCYVDLFPRLTAIAGFELGTGTFVEIIDPAGAARRFRDSEF